MKKKEIFLVLYAFIMIFSPPIIPKLNILILLTLFSILLIIFNWNSFYKKSLMNRKILNYYSFIVLFYTLTILINTFFNNAQYINNSLIIMYKLLILIPCQYTCSIYLINNVRIISTSTDYLYSVLVKAGLIQSFLSIASFISPQIKENFISIMAKNTGSDIFFQNTVYSSASEFRFFGFSSTLLDTFGYGMGILCILAVHLGMLGKKKYFVYLIFLLIPIALNSRSGLFIFVLGVIIYFLFNNQRFSLKSIMGSFFTIILLILSINPIVTIIGKYSPNTLVWINSGFLNLFSFILNNEKSSFEVSDVLFSKQFWTFPQNVTTIIFGSGHDVYGIKDIIGFHSDVGYVNQFWIGGIVGEILIFFFLIFLFINARKNLKFYSSSDLKILYVLFILLFVMNIKADLLSYNPGMIINICLITSYIFFNKEANNV